MLSRNGSNVSSSILTGVINSTATAEVVPLPNIGCNEVTVIAKRANLGSVFIGGSTVSNVSYGVELKASESYTFLINNANLLFAYVENNAEGFSYIALS